MSHSLPGPRIARRRRAGAVGLLGLAVVVASLAVGLEPHPALAAAEPQRPTGATALRDLPAPANGSAIAAPDRILVRFAPGVARGARDNVRSEERLELIREFGLVPGGEVLRVQGRSVEDAIAALERRPDVAYAEPDYLVRPHADPDDEQLFGELWGLHNRGQVIQGTAGIADVDTNTLQGSRVTLGSSNVVVAVIDDGVDFSHVDLAGRSWVNPGESGLGRETNNLDDDLNGFVDDVHGWDFCNGDKTVHDYNQDSHGTHVAGTIAGSLNGTGIVGVAPQVTIMAVKFLCQDGGTTADAISAIEYAADHGVRISNNSWGGAGYSQALKDAIDASGMLFVASAGNGGGDGVGDNNDTSTDRSYPASFSSANILSVAAINNRGSLPSFSNYGPTSVDISAPGVAILSSLPADASGPAGWGWGSGTSMAAPHVTGVAALVASANPSLLGQPLALRQRLLDRGKAAPNTAGKTATGRMIDAARALDLTAPSGSVSVNYGAATSYGAWVRLRLSASDGQTGVTGVRISNSSSSSGGVLTAGRTMTYTSPITWSLTDAAYGGTTTTGARRVYVQFQDAGGNWSPIVSDNIGYVADAPNTCAGATTARALSTWHFDEIFPSKDADWFRFQTSASRYALITLGRLSGDYRLDLYNSGCGLLASSNAAGLGYEQIYRSLPAGTYFVRVSPATSAAYHINPYALRFNSLSESAQILSTGAAWTDGAGRIHIPGEILNNTSSTRSITVTATLYNSANAGIGTVTGDVYRDLVRSRARSPFEVSFTPPAGYHHYRLTIASSATSASPVMNLSITAGTPYTDAEGCHYPGTLRNGNQVSVENARVFATLYDTLGNVVNVGSAVPVASTLGPGASSAFDIAVKPCSGATKHVLGARAET